MTLINERGGKVIFLVPEVSGKTTFFKKCSVGTADQILSNFINREEKLIYELDILYKQRGTF